MSSAFSRGDLRFAIALEFLSPTSFKQNQLIQPFPLPELVFSNLLRRWNTFAPVELQFPKDAMRFTSLQISIEKLIKPDEDSVRIYVLDAGAVKRTITYGSEQPRQDKTSIL